MQEHFNEKSLWPPAIVGAGCGALSFMVLNHALMGGVLPAIAFFAFSTMFGGIAGRSPIHAGAGIIGYVAGFIAAAAATNFGILPAGPGL